MKMAIQKFQEYKANSGKSHQSKRNLIKPNSLITLSNAETTATEMNSIVQQAITDALNNIDSCNTAANVPLENIETPEVSGIESSEFSKDDENHNDAIKKSNAKETLDKGLNLRYEANQSVLLLKLDGRFDYPSCQSQSTATFSQKKFSGRQLPY